MDDAPGSPLFELEDDCELDSESFQLETEFSFDAAPVADLCHSSDEDVKPTVKCDEDETTKRKRSAVDPEIAAYFDRRIQEFAQLHSDSKSRHLPTSEPLPDLPVYHELFPRAQDQAISIVRNLQETVASGETDTESSYMLDCLEQIATPNNPESRTICLYGNCGVSKSSLVNAILGLEDDDSNDVSSVDLGKPAFKTFLALFSDKLEFQDEVAATKFLARARSRDDEKILAKLLSWTKVIYTELTKLGSVIYIYTHTATDLNRRLDPFSQHCEDPIIQGTSLRCFIFPFVKVIRKSLFNPILAKGIVLVDLPDLYEEVGAGIENIRKRSRTGFQEDNYAELGNKRELYQYLKKHIMIKRTEILVAARNEKIRANMKRWYSSATNDPQPLSVFCVSSKCYMAHIKGFLLLEPPLLSVAVTEIPLVRSYLFTVACNGGKGNALKHYYVQIRSLLRQMELSCNGYKPMMKRDHLVRIVQNAQKGVSKSLNNVRQELHKRSITPIIVKFSTEDSWIEKASMLCEKWSKYTFAGHAAFMKHNGNWKTVACGKANWNASLLEVVRDDIQPLLDQLHLDVSYAFKTETMEAMSELVDEMEQELIDNLDSSKRIEFRVFFDILHDRKRTMSNIIEKATKNMQDQILRLNNDALNDGPQSPLTIRMAKIYKDSLKAPTDKIRRTKHAARSAHFRDTVCMRKTSPYLSIKRYLEKEFNKIMSDLDTSTNLHTSMKDGCQTIFKGIMHDFNKVCPDHEDKGVQALKRRDKLGKKVQEGRDYLEGPLMETILECGIEMVSVQYHWRNLGDRIGACVLTLNWWVGADMEDRITFDGKAMNFISAAELVYEIGKHVTSQ
ncbi:hypothetical protein P280DRAFT_548265 [Massarina eburnea CBS 473.64]|uniref:DUF7605 domain-containing protein n=1 Tax=Massarina eburnea CBS 473.64 TaxID=1395130 RepID=A0A6A6S6M8_9PLEO|nr:hypothetical protein P280DRAFT_548265 [Massarina eburnea CBS 473.64]